MNELNLETVVHSGVRVASDNVTSLRMASQEAVQRASGIVLSKRHLPTSQRPNPTDGPRYDKPYGGRTACRAGRLADLAGALRCRRSLAHSSRGTTPATTLPTVLWRTLPFAAFALRHQGNAVGHSRLQLHVGAKRQVTGRISSPRLMPVADAMQMPEGIEARATMRGR
jgi:hypothetical protein